MWSALAGSEGAERQWQIILAVRVSGQVRLWGAAFDWPRQSFADEELLDPCQRCITIRAVEIAVDDEEVSSAVDHARTIFSARSLAQNGASDPAEVTEAFADGVVCVIERGDDRSAGHVGVEECPAAK